MKEFIKKLFCKHKYKVLDAFISHGGMAKTQVLRCEKCGKIKCKTW